MRADGVTHCRELRPSEPEGEEEKVVMKRIAATGVILTCLVLVLLVLYGHTTQETGRSGAGRLVPASATMATAWDVPRDPLNDSTLGNSPDAEQIRRGYRLFMQTPIEAPKYAANRLSCGNCHLNGGQKERALPLVGVAGVFPEYNRRAGRRFSLEDRIVGCFMRSENSTGSSEYGAHRARGGDSPLSPDPKSEEVAAIAAYLRWISEGIPTGEKLPWRGQNVIHPDSLIPVEKLDTRRGRLLFEEHCIACHAKDGQGVQIADKKPGPLWGPDSWNDGAGAARIYTLAGVIRYAMPYLNPGSLTDEEAQQIAAFINSMPRPDYPLKHLDYMQTRIPPDAVYYRKPQEERPR
jgi:thiosulfate dehydrogenase